MRSCRSIVLLTVLAVSTAFAGAAQDATWKAAAAKASLSERDIQRLARDRMLMTNRAWKQVFSAYIGGGVPAYFANHNAFAWQGMVVALKQKGVKAWQFDRKAAAWASFEPGQLFSFPLGPGDGELFRFERPEGEAGQ